MYRRTFVAATTTGAVGAIAGCLGDLLDDVTTFEASPIRTTPDAADEAGYTYEGTDERVEEREFAGESVEATNYVSQYTRTIDLPIDPLGAEPEAGAFALVSTPQVSVADQQFNPVGEMDTAELAEYVQEQYDGLAIDRDVGGRAIGADDIDGLETGVSFDTYEGTATLLGEIDLDVFVDVAQPDHGDDHLVIVAVYPDDEAVPIDSERDRIDTMVRGIEHGDDVEVDLREDDDE